MIRPELMYNMLERVKKLQIKQLEITEEIKDLKATRNLDTDKYTGQWLYDDNGARIDFFFVEKYDEKYNGFRGFGFGLGQDKIGNYFCSNMYDWLGIVQYQIYKPVKKKLFDKWLVVLVDRMKGLIDRVKNLK